MEKVLTALENDIDTLADSIDWVSAVCMRASENAIASNGQTPEWLLSICSTMIYGLKVGT